jgi:hypothetical protein
MFVKSTSVLAICCAMLVLVLTEQPATAGHQHARRHHQILSCRALNANAAMALPSADADLSRYSNAIESAPAGR